MKKNRILLTLLVTVTIGGLVLNGCTATQAETKTTSQSNSQTVVTTDTATYGKVTAINGSAVTLALGTMNMNQNGGGTPPENDGSATPPEKPSGSSEPVQNNTAATSATPADGNQSTMPEILTLTGESTTFTLSDAITLTKMNGQKPDQRTSGSSATTITGTTATASDIAVGSILKITYTSDTTEIQSIEIMTIPQSTGTTTQTTV